MMKRGCLLVVLFFVGAFIMAMIQAPKVDQAEFDDPETLTGGTISDGVSYAIISDTTFQHYKRSVDIRIEETVTEADLRVIARRVYETNEQQYDKTFIGYYLPGMKINSGYWATSHYTPDLEIWFAPE